MTEEDKELLLRDLCSRLPYHPFVYGKSDYVCNEGRLILVTSSGCTIMTGGGSHVHYFFNEINLYLRPMSSMTEEENKEFESLGWRVDELDNNTPWNHNSYNVFIGVDWLNKKMFDYRGLISMGLAIKAPEGMYN